MKNSHFVLWVVIFFFEIWKSNFRRNILGVDDTVCCSSTVLCCVFDVRVEKVVSSVLSSSLSVKNSHSFWVVIFFFEI